MKARNAGPIHLPPTKLWPVSELREAEYNPRTISDQELAELGESIDSFGMVEDVVVNTHPGREGVVVGGHQRLKIARDRGQLELPCKEVSLDPERERELNARLNGNGGRFDPEALARAGYTSQELARWGIRGVDLDAFRRAAAAAATRVRTASADRFDAVSAAARAEAAESEPEPGGPNDEGSDAPAGPAATAGPPAPALTSGSFRSLILTGPVDVVEPCRHLLNRLKAEHGLDTQAHALFYALFPPSGGTA